MTDFQLSGESIEIGPQSLLQKSVTYTNDLTLSHEQNVFSLTFSALSYSDTAANRYRYELERLDRQWTEVGSDRRRATYTTLPAGRYKFRVQGATGSGAWSEPGVELGITILPPWWDTLWFRLVTGAFILVLLGTLYQLRLRQVAREFNMRLDERVSERTRIARELHDTMLQNFQGLMLKLYGLTYMLPDRPVEARETVEGLVEQAQQAMTEGREAVQGLRSSTVITNDLACPLTTLGQKLAAEQNGQSRTAFRVDVEGESRDLHPILRDEVYQIASEAMRNAFHHSGAARIEVDIRYDERQFRVRIRDNGKGMDPKVLDAGGRLGHYGLLGMQERAKLVGGKLAVRSKVNFGTEAELTIPASLAYAKSRSLRRSIFVRKGA